MSEALDYLALHNLLHRDVRTYNMFLSHKPALNEAMLERGDVMVRLGDFGMSIAANTYGARRSLDAWQWNAPETIGQCTMFTHASDVYSLAMCCFHICAHELPFSEYDREGYAVRRDILRTGLRPTLPAFCNAQLVALIESMWNCLLYTSPSPRDRG